MQTEKEEKYEEHTVASIGHTLKSMTVGSNLECPTLRELPNCTWLHNTLLCVRFIILWVLDDGTQCG